MRKSETYSLVPAMLIRNGWVVLAIGAMCLFGPWIENKDKFDPYWSHVIMVLGINALLAVSLQLINGISGQFSLGHAGFMAVGAYLAAFATSTFAQIHPDGEDPIDFAQPFPVLWYFLCMAAAFGVIVIFLYGLFLLIRRSSCVYSGLPMLVAMIVLAWMTIDLSRALSQEHPSAGYIWFHGFATLRGGFDWLLNSGMGIAHKLSDATPANWRKPLCLLFALLGGGGCAAATGFVVGLPTLRLRGDYLAIATLGFAEIIRVVITNSEPLGRATGISIATYANAPDETMRGHYVFPWIFGMLLLATLMIWRLTHSPKGQAIRAVREDEIAAASMGIDTTHHKVLAFVIGAFFAGIAGGLFAHLDGYVNPGQFELSRSIEMVVMVTLGGLGSIWGALIAAALLTLLPQWLRGWEDFKQLQMVFYSLALIVLMVAKARPWRKWSIFNRRATA